MLDDFERHHGMDRSYRLAPRRFRALMSTRERRPPVRHATDNSQALAAFIACKAEIDTILTRLTTLSAEHFNGTPDDITWADVGTLSSYLEGLRRVADAAFHEGEHAA
jgi:hypothetical protein